MAQDTNNALGYIYICLSVSVCLSVCLCLSLSLSLSLSLFLCDSLSLFLWLVLFFSLSVSVPLSLSLSLSLFLSASVSLHIYIYTPTLTFKAYTHTHTHTHSSARAHAQPLSLLRSKQNNYGASAKWKISDFLRTQQTNDDGRRSVYKSWFVFSLFLSTLAKWSRAEFVNFTVAQREHCHIDCHRALTDFILRFGIVLGMDTRLSKTLSQTNLKQKWLLAF